MSAPTEVVVTAVAYRLADLEREAFKIASSAFEGYGSDTDWKASDGRRLVAKLDSAVRLASDLMLGRRMWQADYVVSVEEPY